MQIAHFAQDPYQINPAMDELKSLTSFNVEIIKPNHDIIMFLLKTVFLPLGLAISDTFNVNTYVYSRLKGTAYTSA